MTKGKVDLLYVKIVLAIFAGFSSNTFSVEGQGLCIPQDAHGVQRKVWTNIKDASLVSIKKDPRYPETPTMSDFITTLEAPRRFEAFYAQTLSAYFIAPETGNHVFYMACDDYCQLQVSGNHDPRNAQLVIDVKYYTNYRLWESDTNKPSRPIPMVAGKLYYIHAIMVQDGGSEHLSIGVRLPSGLNNRPMTSNHLLKYPLKDINNMTSLGAWGEWTPCSKSCGEGMQTRSRFCLQSSFMHSVEKAKFIENKTRTCRFEIPCAMPPRKILAQTNNHSSVRITWLPFNFKPSVLVEYRLTYQSITSARTRRQATYSHVIRGSNEGGEVIIPPSYQSVILSGLRASTKYCIQMVTITIFWESPPSECVIVTTDEYIPSLPPAIVTAMNRTGFDKALVTWSKVPKRGQNGRIQGYIISIRALSSGSIELHESKNWTISLNSSYMSTILTGLESYTVYEIQVAAFTSKGTGPYSNPVYIETCLCPPKLQTNWWTLFPLQETSSVTSQAEGIFPRLIRGFIDSKCGWCHNNIRTSIDFYEVQSFENGTTKSALKMNLSEVINSISSSDISFPLSVINKNTLYGDNFKFVEVFKLSSGVAYINRRLTAEVYASMVGSSVFQCWPLLFLIIVMSMLSGIILCILESISYPVRTCYRSSFLKGVYEYIWCAFISMTTVGYGDRYSRSIQGRMFSIIWFLVGSIMTCIFVASLASSLYVNIVSVTKNPERKGKIGVVKGTTEHKIAIRINGTKGIHCVEYLDFNNMVNDLNDGILDGVLLDAIRSNSLNDTIIPTSLFQVAKTFNLEVNYGIGLSRDAIKLDQLFKEYINEHPVKLDINEKKQRKSNHSTDLSKATTHSSKKENKKKYINFFDPSNSLYMKTLYFTSGFLIGAVACGLFFYYLTSRKQYQKQSNQDLVKYKISPQLITEQREILRTFYRRCVLVTDHLRHKHKQQRLIFIETLHKQNQQKYCMVSWLHHFKEKEYIPGNTAPKPVIEHHREFPESNLNTETML